MTNDIQRGVISILYSALTREKNFLPEHFDFSEAVKIAKKHKIEVMFYYGALNCGFAQDDPLMQELFTLVCSNIAVSEQQMYLARKLFSSFDEQKVEYMPLKGILLKQIYPKPEMRAMGDADILIKTEQYKIIKPIMQELGYSEVTESDHEFVWKKQNMHIELHKRLVPSYNKDYYKYFGNGWHLAIKKTGTSYSMTDEDQMIYLFTHFAKHYRDAGIGIRHIIDLWVYRKNKPKMDESYIKKELKALQLYNFYLNVINTLSVWFDGKTADFKTDLITDTIFNSGVYGTTQAHILSGAVKISKSTNHVKTKKFFMLAFLPYKNMCMKYPFVKKMPFLLPVMWVYRILIAIFFKSKNIKFQKKAIDFINNDKINGYQKSLNIVGLDFNFKE